MMQLPIRLLSLVFLGMLVLPLLGCQEKKTKKVSVEGPESTYEIEVESTKK